MSLIFTPKIMPVYIPNGWITVCPTMGESESHNDKFFQRSIHTDTKMLELLKQPLWWFKKLHLPSQYHKQNKYVNNEFSIRLN